MTKTLDLPQRYREELLSLLETHVPAAEVWAYGSRVTGTNHEGSDLDIVLRGPELQKLGSEYPDLLDAIEESTIPILIDVFDWARLPQSFHSEIERRHFVLRQRGHLRLADVAEIVMGQSPSSETVSDDDGIPLLNGPTEFGSYHPVPVQFTNDARRYALKGDILFCVRGSTTGRMNWADRRYAIGRGIAAIRHKSDPRLQPFVRGVIERELPSLLSSATGSTFPNVSAKQLGAVAFPCLGLKSQEQAASALGVLDDRIELNRQMCETLEEMARVLYKAWFVDFDPVQAKMEGRWREGESLPGLPAELYHLFPHELVDSQLGPIPAGWRICRLDEAADHSRQTVDPSRSPELEYCHYSIPAFDSGKRPVTEPGNAIRSNKCVVHPNTVLLSRLNPDVERVWLVGPEPGEAAIASTEFAVLHPKLPTDSAFLYCALRSDRYRNALVGLVTGTSKSHQRVRPQALAATTLLMPPQEVLAEFSVGVSQWLRQTLELRSASQCLTETRDKLLPKLISGEVRISGSEQMAGVIGC